ncbi:50S ribosomal protein L4 [Candidatus Margulisiibacteriota bacterium]
MVKLKVFDKKGAEAGGIEASEKLFEAKYSPALVHHVLRAYRSGQRAGTHSTKKRGEVRGGGKKPWKQKGTGRARAGSIRSPLWNGGGVIFGPKPRDHSFPIPKKMVRAALRAVISDRFSSDRIIIIDELNIEKPKTKEMVKILKALEVAGQKILLLLPEGSAATTLAGRNISKFKSLNAKAVNIYDLLNCEWLLVTKDAIPVLDEVLA